MLLKYLLKRWHLLAIYMVAVIAAPIVNANAAFVSGDMLDYAEGGEYQLFVKSLVLFLGYFVAHGILLFIVQALRVRIVSGCRRDLRQDMFHNVMSADNTFFSKPDAGFHVAAFTNDITILESHYFEAWLTAIEGIISIATAIVAIVTLNTHLAVIIIGGELIGILICFIFRGYSIKKNRNYIDKLAAFTQRIKDYFSSFSMIRNYSVENNIIKRFKKMNDDTEDAKDDADLSIVFVNRLAHNCISMIKFVMVGYGLTLVILGKMTMGVIFSAFQFSDQLVGPMNTFMSNLNNIHSVKSILARIKGIVDASKRESEQRDMDFDGPVTLTLDNVGVSIGDNRILDGISHVFEPGKKYLIIGRNGAGKSTLLKLLKRSTENYDGSILINGQDTRNLSYRSLSSVVSYINESVSLTCDTVRENILLYRDVSEEDLKGAVNAVGLKVELDRVIRDGDRNISSGETRRIEIARSLIGKSDVIIYDEAISTLDIPTAYEIEKTLLGLKDQTILFVSHNFSTQLIDKYDEIILLDGGKICDCGTHSRLMETSEYYRNIMKIKNG